MKTKDYTGEYGPPVRTSGMAVFSLVAGILSYFMFFFVGAVAAVILGHAALGEMRRSEGRVGGRGLAVTGLVLGYVQVVGVLLLGLVLLGLVLVGIVAFSGSDVQVSDDAVLVKGPAGTRIEVREKEGEVRVSAPGTEIEVTEDRVVVSGPGGTHVHVKDHPKHRVSTGRDRRASEKAGKLLARIEEALIDYWLDAGSFPSMETGLRALVEKPEGSGSWRGPYIDDLPRDPWGREYVYRLSENRDGKFQVFSLGPDGVESDDDVR